MLAIDTNVFVRIFIQDDEIQSYQAKKFAESHDAIFVDTAVLCEALWLFKTHFKYNKSQLIAITEKILKTKQFHFEYRDALWHALNECQYINADLTDCIIGAVAKLHHCHAVMTFDKNAAKSKNFKLMK